MSSRTCSMAGCTAVIRPNNRSGRCELHRRSKDANTRSCSFVGCGKALPSNNTTDRCRTHRRVKSDAPPQMCSFTGCREMLISSNTTGRCRTHRRVKNSVPPRMCSFATCNSLLGEQNKSGRCIMHRSLVKFPNTPISPASASVSPITDPVSRTSSSVSNATTPSAAVSRTSSSVSNTTTPSAAVSRTSAPYDDTNTKVDLEDYKKKHHAMDDTHKWRLMTGKVVEDALFEYGLTQTNEHLVHQFVMDPYSPEMETIFNAMELAEIRTSNIKPLPPMPTALRDYIATFNKTTAKEIRETLDTRQPWQLNYDLKEHGDYDWARNSVYNMVRVYESGALDRPHHETWYLAQIWRFVDSAFDNVPEVEAVRGESSSYASADRKNKQRQPQDRKKIGRKCDIIIRSTDSAHNTPKEYGAGEAGPIMDAKGTKMRKEGQMKLPKVMRDMFNNLAAKIDHAKLGHLQIVGYLHYGKTQLMALAHTRTHWFWRL
ncbi:hypothetical protein BC940DRAFT_303641 [Gongronella butleri]|nr:hypothetical protein BC940DRAFT_303641 [Gongronella butleri]